MYLYYRQRHTKIKYILRSSFREQYLRGPYSFKIKGEKPYSKIVQAHYCCYNSNNILLLFVEHFPQLAKSMISGEKTGQTRGIFVPR